MVLAWYTKSTGHDDYFADLSWMFSVWLEAFALMPQVKLLCLGGGHAVDTDALHFACTTLLASLTFAAFWGKTCRDKYDQFHQAVVLRFMYGILTAAGIRVIMCCCYAYLFANSSKRLMKSAFGRGGQEYELCAQDDEEL